MHRLATLVAGQYRVGVRPTSFGSKEVVQLLPCRCPPAGFQAVHPVPASFKTIPPAGFKVGITFRQEGLRPAHFEAGWPNLKLVSKQAGLRSRP